MVRLLSNAGSDINAGKSMGEVKGITPLHQAVSNKHVDAVKALVDLGADVNARATGEIHYMLHLLQVRSIYMLHRLQVRSITCCTCYR